MLPPTYYAGDGLGVHWVGGEEKPRKSSRNGGDEQAACQQRKEQRHGRVQRHVGGVETPGVRNACQSQKGITSPLLTSLFILLCVFLFSCEWGHVRMEALR